MRIQFGVRKRQHYSDGIGLCWRISSLQHFQPRPTILLLPRPYQVQIRIPPQLWGRHAHLFVSIWNSTCFHLIASPPQELQLSFFLSLKATPEDSNQRKLGFTLQPFILNTYSSMKTFQFCWIRFAFHPLLSIFIIPVKIQPIYVLLQKARWKHERKMEGRDET